MEFLETGFSGFFEEEHNQCADEASHGAAVERESGAGDFYATGEIEIFIEPRNVVVRESVWGYGFCIAPGIYGLVVLFIGSDGNGFVRDVGDCEEKGFPLGIDVFGDFFEFLNIC